MSQSKEKKNKPPEAVPEKDLTGILDKDFKTTVLTMLKELKKYGGGIMKIMYEQIENIHKEIENLEEMKNIFSR